MRWEYRHGVAPTNLRVLLDGERVPKVRAFDTEEGWVRALCQEEHGNGEGGHVHVNPDDRTLVCEWTRRGVVALEPLEHREPLR